MQIIPSKFQDRCMCISMLSPRRTVRSTTGGPSSSCEMIILRNNDHGGIIRVCMGIFTSALKNKKIRQILKKKYLTSLPQRSACYLTAYFDEKSPFERVVHFEVFNAHEIEIEHIRLTKFTNAICGL